MRKVCTKCKQEKDITEFNKGKGYKDLRRSYCRKCQYEFYGKPSKRKILLAKKGNCLICGDKLGLCKRNICSKESCKKERKKQRDKSYWQEQKNTPGYKEYHREIARKWAKDHYKPRKKYESK